MKNVFYYFFVGLIFIISFFLYSSRYYPLLQSDDALNILMAHYYKLPHDIYCWGQDRGGTLIPLISQLFIKIFHFSALNSVSLSNYLILALGFIGFSSLFKTYFSKMLFALIWFLPFQRFVELLRYPIGVEYSLIGFAIFLLCKLDPKAALNNLKNNLILFAVALIFIISIWVSDLAAVTIGILLFISLIYNYLKNKMIIINHLYLIYFIFGFILCFLFIKYAKSFAVVKIEHYLSFNDISHIKLALFLIGKSFLDVLTFKTKEILIGIYTYGVILLLITFIIFVIKNKLLLILLSNKWITFFTIDFMSVFIIILFSSWVLANGMGRWYFVGCYISLTLAIILAVEQLQIKKINVRFFRIFLVVIAFIGAISPIYSMIYISPKTFKPKADIVKEFNQLGKIGIIAEYWNSYITSCANPEMIKAIPNDKTWPIRNEQLVSEVFKQNDIYLIKDMWLDNFPDSIIQYDRLLKKDGKELKIGNCDICKYKKVN